MKGVSEGTGRKEMFRAINAIAIGRVTNLGRLKVHCLSPGVQGKK